MLSVVKDESTEPKPFNASFDDFWTLWPKRVAKKDAEKLWTRLSEADRVKALVGICKWREVWLATGELRYVPNASTWLFGERWDDDLPAEWAARATHASQTAFPARPAVEARGEIPAHVREAIAKLRKT